VFLIIPTPDIPLVGEATGWACGNGERMTNPNRSYKRLRLVLLMIVVIAVAVALGRAGLPTPSHRVGMWDGPL
jgi:hypothetical protein